jgi:hypothetical protein
MIWKHKLLELDEATEGSSQEIASGRKAVMEQFLVESAWPTLQQAATQLAERNFRAELSPREPELLDDRAMLTVRRGSGLSPVAFRVTLLSTAEVRVHYDRPFNDPRADQETFGYSSDEWLMTHLRSFLRDNELLREDDEQK